MIKGNKGEWSEVYALFKMLSDKKLTVGDSQLNQISDLIYPIIEVLRVEGDNNIRFSYNDDIVLINSKEQKFRIAISEFEKYANLLLDILKSDISGAFSVIDIETFLQRFSSFSIKAKSTVKSDIQVVIHDFKTGLKPKLGFSIKSRLGGASTLLNAGKTTNFIFEVKNLNLSDETIEFVNAITTKNKIQDRIAYLKKQGGILSFSKMENTTFYSNLMLIDSGLPIIMAESLLIYFSSKANRLIDVIPDVEALNPLCFDTEQGHPFYTYKVKKMLTDIALGMVPAKVWLGQWDATGGYIVVKEDGELLCYHVYNKNEFEEYLFSNTRFETASSSRHNFGSLYKEGEKLFFKLNLQIRFL
ncbi:HpaII family restriction endonuclease [Myroides phaeus]|uniref:Type II restriction enzyme n=1 Tax=Myroides phaeus TaxID=702745 RepID=A0A1G8EEG3_9FLAO|nr:HpaII family restriction endonuclease [Myroides phaeus]SDH68099.1 type II restriction enzyme [Myroides phaeus]